MTSKKNKPTATNSTQPSRTVRMRLKEAKLLLDQRDWDGAYYLAGYAIEFAFKIRIIGRLMQSDSFPEKKLADNFYKHDLALLRKLADLDEEMELDAATSAQWEIVKDWSEQTRYTLGKTEQDATQLYEAIETGVIPWIKARW